jgi:hypothetical protein
MIGISTVQFGVRLSLAIGMGAIVGLERQWRQRMAREPAPMLWWPPGLHLL